MASLIDVQVVKLGLAAATLGLSVVKPSGGDLLMYSRCFFLTMLGL